MNAWRVLAVRAAALIKSFCRRNDYAPSERKIVALINNLRGAEEGVKRSRGPLLRAVSNVTLILFDR